MLKLRLYVKYLLQVRHSQRANDTPLVTWVICEGDGVIESAHCTCMAGLGEVCSHVGALLFYLESASRVNKDRMHLERAQSNRFHSIFSNCQSSIH